MNLQHLILFGRATRDAELIETKKKVKFAKFSIAINEFNKKSKSESASFYDVLVFGNTSTTLINTVKKGDHVIVEGKPEVEAYLSKDNEPKATISVLAESWRVIKPKLDDASEVMSA